MMKSSAAVGANSGYLRSTALTQKPSLFSRFTRCAPINPPPPHTNADFDIISSASSTWLLAERYAPEATYRWTNARDNRGFHYRVSRNLFLCEEEWRGYSLNRADVLTR